MPNAARMMRGPPSTSPRSSAGTGALGAAGNMRHYDAAPVMVMVIYSALVRSHQSTSAGSFGLVRPAWITYTRSAVPQNVEGFTRPPRTRTPTLRVVRRGRARRTRC